jgi:hypothetical protein
MGIVQVPKVGLYAVGAVITWLVIHTALNIVFPVPFPGLPGFGLSSYVGFYVVPSLDAILVILIPFCMMGKRWAFAAVMTVAAVSFIAVIIQWVAVIAPGGFPIRGLVRGSSHSIMHILIIFLSFRAYAAMKIQAKAT